MSNYIPILSKDINGLPDGTEVIVERKNWDKMGYPVESDFYRAIIGHHISVCGTVPILTAVPNCEFPRIPSWQGWIYAHSLSNMQLWRKRE